MSPDTCRRNGGHSRSGKCSIPGGEPPQYPFYARQKELSEVESPVWAGIFCIDPEVLPKGMVISYSATSDEYIERYIFKHMHSFFSIKNFLEPEKGIFFKKMLVFQKEKICKFIVINWKKWEKVGKNAKKSEKIKKDAKEAKHVYFFAFAPIFFLIYYAEKRAGCVAWAHAHTTFLIRTGVLNGTILLCEAKRWEAPEESSSL